MKAAGGRDGGKGRADMGGMADEAGRGAGGARYVDAAGRRVFKGSLGATAPVVYAIDLPEHPFDVDAALADRASTVVKLPVWRWDDSLTPWPAPGLYEGDADFKGEASVTLGELVDAAAAIERAEGLAPIRRAVAGYSLGGLFSLFAFTRSSFFDACACLSGSVWYEGWVEDLRGRGFDGRGRFAFLSIGKKERLANPPILHCVEDNMRECARILRAHGCEVAFQTGPGSHLERHLERFDAGVAALDGFLTRAE